MIMDRSPANRPRTRDSSHGALAVALISIVMAHGVASYAIIRNMAAKMDANVSRQEEIRLRQFAELRAQIAQDMEDHDAATNAELVRTIDSWFSAAGNRMAVVTVRRDRVTAAMAVVVRGIALALGVDADDLAADRIDSILAEPLPHYPDRIDSP